MSRATHETLAPAVRPSLRSKIKGIRFTAAELQDICLAARACGLTPSEFLRRSALNLKVDAKPPVPEINAKSYAALGKIGTNINQIAARLNGKTGAKVDEHLSTALGLLIPTLRDIRRDLLGGRT